MYILLFLITFYFLLNRRGNRGYKLLVFIQLIGFLSQFIIGLEYNADSINALFNIIFTCINIILIHIPWSKVSFSKIYVQDRYLLFLNKYLRPVLYLNLILSAILGVIIIVFLPSIVDFKQGGVKELYESIPYFANAFRYAYTSQYFGYIGIPICLYYLSNGYKKQSLLWLLASMSSLVAGIAFYSRANIICFTIEYLVFYLFFENNFPVNLRHKLNRVLVRGLLIVTASFIVMSYSRFSQMDYLSDRIPQNSLIKDITSYYLLYYASQGFPYGIESLEKYTPAICMDGSRSFYQIKQIIGFFGNEKFDAESAMDRVKNVLGEELYDKFLGYTSYSVYDVGYCGTLFISLWFTSYIMHLFRKKRVVKMETLLVSSLLIQVTINSLFYGCFGAILIPYLLLVCINILFKFNILR